MGASPTGAGPTVAAKPLAGLRLSRREAMEQAIGLMSAMGLAGLAVPAAAMPGADVLPGAEDLRAMVLALLGHVIADTDTPGARSPDNAQFVMRAVAAGLFGIRPDTLIRLYHDFGRLMPRPFARSSHGVQAAALARMETETFAGPEPVITPWLSIKALVLMAYFTSQAGASQQLRYEIVPGRYDPDLPLDKDWKPLSSDWSANAIRKAIA